MTFGSLFTGIGGFDLGFERAGLKCAWQVECDGNAVAVLHHRWPDVERHTHVETVGKGNLGAVDVVVGGFPCQDLSLAGRRLGLAGERSGLWFEFRRILSELRPGICVIENVPGLLSSHGGRDFAIILQGLVELGYRVSWRVLDSGYFGVPQRRRRVFIVGSLGGRRTGQILFESKSVQRNVGASQGAGAQNQRAAGERVDGGGELARCLTGRWRNQADTDTVVASFSPLQSRGDCRGLKLQHESCRALHRSQIEAVLVGASVRRLTPTEYERLQGFPDGWTLVPHRGRMMADTPRYRLIGNAVAVPVAESLGVAIKMSKANDCEVTPGVKF